jgi:hypothetical protein
MEITRELLSQTHWQCADGRKVVITDMDDKHLRNSIRMIKRQQKVRDDEDRRYALALLEAEQTFRKQGGQQQFDFSMPVERPQSLLRVKAAGSLPQDLGKLTRALDGIAMKHHGLTVEELWDECDDPRDYGYDGDCW